MNTYSVNEAAELLGISPRAVHSRCKKSNVRKKDNKYLITDEYINEWKTGVLKNVSKFKNILSKHDQELNNTINSEIQVIPTLSDSKQLDIEIQSLQIENERLKEELKQYDIEPNERLEVFTNEAYTLFEQRLIEWKEQRTELIHQEENFNIQIASKEELLSHYKNQFEYQKKQSDKILEMHQKLIDTIENQIKNTIQRTIIEAKEKDIIDINWQKKNT